MAETKRARGPLQEFLRTEAGAGVVLLVMVPIALIWANTSGTYEDLWSTKLGIHIGFIDLDLDLRHWVNDGLMAIFFFVVGLEIKRELVVGELRDPRKALTPVMAAIGGMAAPALIYVAFTNGTDAVGGWGIPMATDIAIVLGFLALAGDRVPLSLKMFLLTLAIVDDIGAIAVIAIFYSDHAFNPLAFGIAIALLVAGYAVRKAGLRIPYILWVLAVCVWIAVYQSGIHATIAGVALALLTPAVATDIKGEKDSPLDRLQHLLHPFSSYLVLPVFALANAGIILSGDAVSDAIDSSTAHGIVAGLVLGKPLGIVLFTAIAIYLLKSKLPGDLSLKKVAAGSVLAGVGFTVSLFITDLAFDDESITQAAKAGVLAASVIAGGVGFALLRLVFKPERNPVS